MLHPKPCFQDHRQKYGTHHWEQFKDHVLLKSICMATVVTGASASQKRNVQESKQEKKHQLPDELELPRFKEVQLIALEEYAKVMTFVHNVRKKKMRRDKSGTHM